MKIVEMYLNTMIERHDFFTATATRLLEEIPSLTPIAIDHRCRDLAGLHHGLIADKEHFFTLMEFVGPGILDTASIGEFQRALDRSIHSCTALFEELQIYRKHLVFEGSTVPST